MNLVRPDVVTASGDTGNALVHHYFINIFAKIEAICFSQEGKENDFKYETVEVADLIVAHRNPRHLFHVCQCQLNSHIIARSGQGAEPAPEMINSPLQGFTQGNVCTATAAPGRRGSGSRKSTKCWNQSQAWGTDRRESQQNMENQVSVCP
jgi:hypothetical protein